MKPGQEMQYDPEEIKKWKKLIYGQHWTNNKVDEWASTDQGSRRTGRRKVSNKTSSSNNDSFSNSSYGGSDDWLHSPGGGQKRNYRSGSSGKKPLW